MSKTDSDIELKASVDLDASGIREQLQRELSNIYTEVGGDAFFKGKANKDWNSIPFYQAHSSGGAVWTTNVLNAGMSKDLKQLGYDTGSNYYQNAMLASSVQSLGKNGYDRFGMLNAFGYPAAASMAHPDSEMGKILEANKRLMSMPFARDYISDNMIEEDVLTPSGRKKFHHGANGEKEYEKTKKYNFEADFQGMRDRAVEMGLGKWTDENKHDASTFEFIDKEMDKINDKSNKTKKATNDWHTELKRALGTLTAIAGIGIKVFNSAMADTDKRADSAPKTRYFLDMSYMDILRTNKADKVMGFGSNAIYNDINKLAMNRAEFKTLGSGLDALFPSLLGVFRSITETTDPFQAYKDITQALINETMASADDPNRKQQLEMLMNKMGYSTMTSIAGSLADPKGLGKEYEYSAYKLFEFANENPLRGALSDIEALNAKITEVKDSIDSTWSYLFKNFNKNFGEPFLQWWDDFLLRRVIGDVDHDGFNNKTGNAQGEQVSVNLLRGAMRTKLTNQYPSMFTGGDDISSLIYKAYDTDKITTFSEIEPNKKGTKKIGKADVTTNSDKYDYLTGNKDIPEELRKSLVTLFGNYGAINKFKNDKEEPETEALEENILNAVHAMTMSVKARGATSFDAKEIQLIELMMESYGYVKNPYYGNPSDQEWRKKGGDEAAKGYFDTYNASHPEGVNLSGATFVINSNANSIQGILNDLRTNGVLQGN